MSTTVVSPNFEISYGGAHFFQLRCAIAKETNKEIYQHYLQLITAPMFGEERKQFFIKYNKRIAELDKKYEYKFSSVLDFLYLPDCDGSLSIKQCKDLYAIVKDNKNRKEYGQFGETLADFAELLEDCIRHRRRLKWY